MVLEPEQHVFLVQESGSVASKVISPLAGGAGGRSPSAGGAGGAPIGVNLMISPLAGGAGGRSPSAGGAGVSPEIPFFFPVACSLSASKQGRRSVWELLQKFGITHNNKEYIV